MGNNANFAFFVIICCFKNCRDWSFFANCPSRQHVWTTFRKIFLWIIFCKSCELSFSRFCRLGSFISIFANYRFLQLVAIDQYFCEQFEQFLMFEPNSKSHLSAAGCLYENLKIPETGCASWGSSLCQAPHWGKVDASLDLGSGQWSTAAGSPRGRSGGRRELWLHLGTEGKTNQSWLW